MSQPDSIYIGPTKALQEEAFELAGIPTDGALFVHPDGRLGFEARAADAAEVLSKLTGAVLADHAVKTMVLPSNVATLREVLGALRRVYRDAGFPPSSDLVKGLVGAIEDLERVVGNLQGLADDRP